MDKKYVYRNFGPKYLPQLNMGIFLEYTETNLFFEKNEFLYTFILVWFKTKLCLELTNSIFIWNWVIFFIATLYYFLGLAEKRLLHVMFFSQKVVQNLFQVPAIDLLISNQNLGKMFSNNSKKLWLFLYWR